MNVSFVPATARKLAISCVVSIGAAGCGGAGPGATGPGAIACEEGDLPGCERALSAAVAASAALEKAVPRELVAAYVEARRDADGDDVWAWTYDALGEPGMARTALVVIGEPPPGLKDPPKGTKRVDVATAPPALTGMTEDALWLAIGESKGLAHVVVTGPGRPVGHYFPRDPLAPFMAGLLPAIHGEGGVATVGVDIAIGSAVHEALSHARASDYVSAAPVADRLRALVEGRDPNAEPVLRASYAVQLLAATGIALEVKTPETTDAALNSPKASDADATAKAPAGPPRAAGDTAYGNLLRVRTSGAGKETYQLRRDHILDALPKDRHPAMDDYFDPPPVCGPPKPLPMDGPRDLIFASRLSSTLESSGAGGAGLDLPEWFATYRRAVDAVAQTGTTWAYAPSLLYERGEQRGLSPHNTDVYRRVTELAKRHIEALEALEKSNPGRFASFSLLGLIYAPGVLRDEQLRDAVIALTQSTVRDKMAHATEAKGVAEALLTGVMSGMSYPPAIQGAHYLALQGAFTAKLRGDLKAKTGWDVAGLYAADAIFRVLTEQSPNLSATAADVQRALRDPKIEIPALAALAVAGSRYAVLGAEGNLSAQVLERGAGTGVRTDRIEARNAIRSALENLGGPGEAPAPLVDDVADLADGFIAATVVALSEPPPPTVQCATATGWKPPANVRRALDKLADKRTAILRNPAYRQGDGLWVRRTRLLVTLLSDALDIMRRGEEPARFAIPEATARDDVRAALREWDEPAAIEAIGGGYGLTRRVFAAGDADEFLAMSGEGVRELLGGLAKLLDEEGQASGLGGSIVLEVLRSKPLTPGEASNLPDTFLGYAKKFYDAGQKDQGDLMLMAWITVAAIVESKELDPAIDLAHKHQSRLLWSLLLGRAREKIEAGEDPDVTVVTAPLSKASDDACAELTVEPILAVVDAVGDFSSGKRDDARKKLDRMLDQSEKSGLVVGALNYNYQESTRTRIFTLYLGLSPNGGMLSNANALQLGLGMRSDGTPGGSLEVSATKKTDPKALADAGKVYVHAAATAAIYHFLQGDGDSGARAAQRAAGAAVRGVKLGPLVVSADPTGEDNLAYDARGALAIAAQLAAEDGRPFLAGDLWAVAKSHLGETATDEEVDAILDPVPLGLSGVKDVDRLLERTKKSVAILTSSLPCVIDKPKLIPAYDQASCEDYPVGLSLRISDGLTTLPRLRRTGGGDATCAALASLDAFLALREGGNYDPDKFTEAVDALRGAGRDYDAGALLARQRNPVHCSPGIVATARQLGRGNTLPPDLAADVLSAAVNCSVGAVDEEVIADFVAIDRLTRDLADPTRGFKILLFGIELALQKNEPRVLAALAAQERFIDRWMDVGALTGVSALVIHHAAALLDGKAPATGPSARSHKLLCETYPPVELESLCNDLASMRDAKRSVDERAKVARGALRKVAELVTAPPAP